MKKTLAIIEKGIPPPARAERALRSKYPFHEVQVGDSLVLDHIGTGSFRNYAFRHGWKVATQTISPGTHRCWRLV